MILFTCEEVKVKKLPPYYNFKCALLFKILLSTGFRVVFTSTTGRWSVNYKYSVSKLKYSSYSRS